MKRIVIVFLVILFFLAPCAAQSKSSAKTGISDLALLFQFQGLTSPLSPFADGMQTGAGIKYWLMDPLALRGLLSFSYDKLPEEDGGNSEIHTGLGAGLEWHMRPGKVSPYVGGLLGVEILNEHDPNVEPDPENPETSMDFYGGAMGGMEMVLFNNLSLFAEYALILSVDAYGFHVTFGQSAVLGFAIYL